MHSEQSDRMIPLSRAAQMMGVPYQHAHALALRGEIDAEFYLNKRWMASQRSVERFIAERSTPATSGGS